jgi:hypothetical protein
VVELLPIMVAAMAVSETPIGIRSGHLLSPPGLEHSLTRMQFNQRASVVDFTNGW